MTAQSSSKGFFGTYLKYRLGALKINFVMCCILNVLALPLYAISAKKGVGGVVSEFAMTGRVFSMMCIIALPIIAILNAVLSFDYYHKKDLTDTMGVLPLTHRERFFADLLVGYAINAAPIIPCGIFCAVVMGSAQEEFKAVYGIADSLCNFSMAGLGVVIAVTLFLIVSFAYLFSVLIITCCGKIFHSVIFSLIGMAVLPLFFGGIVRCFVNGVVGVDSKEYFFKAIAFFPPLGLLDELFNATGVAFETFLITDPSTRVGEFFAVGKPVYIAVYVLLAAGLIAGAYFIGKRRLAENTGSTFAVKPMFTVICTGITAAVTIVSLAVNYDLFKHYIIFSAALGAVTCLVTILLNPQKKKKLLRSIIFGAAAIGIMIGVSVLFDKTGSFGARYLPKDADSIEYLKVENTFTITDKADIEKYISLLNDKLRETPNIMFYRGDGFCVEIKKADGRTVERRYNYSVSDYYYGKYSDTSNNYLEELIKQLDGYVGYFFDDLGDVSDNWGCRLYTKTTYFEIPANKTKEFITLLREEASEKHSPDAKIFADVYIATDNTSRKFEIEENFGRTIEFLESLDDNIERDPEAPYLVIKYNNEYKEWLKITIPYKDRNNEKVKELVSLFETVHGNKVDKSFEIMMYYATGENTVTEKNKDRVLELMTEIAADQING